MAVTVEQLGEFLRQPVPRTIPSNIRARKLQGSLGCFGFLFGLLFGGFGMIFVVIFFPWRLWQELALDLGDPAVARGLVSSTETTGMSVNETTVVRVRFAYDTPDERHVEGESYTTGNKFEPEQEVQVEYLSWRTSVCRAKGSRLNPFGYWPSFVILFPLIGFTVFGCALVSRRRAIRILRHGGFAMGKISQIKALNVEINNVQQYRVSVEYQHQGETRIGSLWFPRTALDSVRQHHESGEPVGVLYDPARPKRVILADTLLE
jgi:hypothetical protein